MLPPPTPPPPRITAASFAAASNAQIHLARAHRRPTFHLAVILSPSPVSVLRHAHHVQALLSAKGLHVFLQTELTVHPNNLVPITAAAIPDLAIHSSADFFAVVTEANLPSASVRVRLSPTADFVELAFPELLDAIFEAWTRLLRTDRDLPPHIANALAFNPNIVTDKQLDVLLQSCADVPELRRSYTKLLRLVHITHDWGSPSPYPQNLPQAPHVQLNADSAHGSGTKTEQVIDQPKEDPGEKDSGEGESTQPDSKTDSEVEGDRSAGAIQTNLNESESAESGGVSDELKPMHESALRDGLRAVLRKGQSSKTEPKRKRRPRQDFSMSWLKRSDDLAARIVRSQLLARSLHEDLIQTFDAIALMPVGQHVLRSDSRQEPSLPSEVHRRRLLREINDLLPRIEELGKRLSKRPRTRRRKNSLLEVDPWQSYNAQATAAAENSPRRRDIAGFVGDAARGDPESGIQCCACGSFTEPRFRECAVCRVKSVRKDRQWWPANLELFRKRFQETINCAPGPPAPWVFAPGVLPMHPMPNSNYPNGIGPKESVRRNLKARSPVKDERRIPHALDSGPSTKQLRGAGQQQNPYSLAAQFQSMAVQDKYAPIPRNGIPLSSTAGDQAGAHGPSSIRTKALGASDQGLLLASSPPNDNLHVDLNLSRRGTNGRLHYSGTGAQGSSSAEENGISSRHFGAESLRTISNAGLTEAEAGHAPIHHSFSPPDSSNTRFHTTTLSPGLAVPGNLLAQHSAQNQSLMPRGSMESSTMNELAIGSYEAPDDMQWIPNLVRKNGSKPGVYPGPASSGDFSAGSIDSLQALAAASDAANGGTGSATRESLRAVSALVSAGKSQSNQKEDMHRNGVYNMF